MHPILVAPANLFFGLVGCISGVVQLLRLTFARDPAASIGGVSFFAGHPYATSESEVERRGAVSLDAIHWSICSGVLTA
jgi:hypothetical protein